MATVEKKRIWWNPASWFARKPRVQGTSAWFVSLLVHCGILVLLASITLYKPIRDRISLSIEMGEKADETIVPQALSFSPEVHDKVGALSEHGFQAARPSAPTQGLESRIEMEIAPANATAVAAVVGNIQVHDFNRTILQGPNLPENMIIKGSGGVGATGAVGAVDRITKEILLSLDERPTLVAWLFDQSGSLKPQRESIAKRFDRIYKELGIIEKSGNNAFKQHGDQPLLTVVAEFGNSVDFLTPKPIDDLSAIKAAVRSIKDDPKDNGKENVFQSVGFVAEKFRHYRLASSTLR